MADVMKRGAFLFLCRKPFFIWQPACATCVEAVQYAHVCASYTASTLVLVLYRNVDTDVRFLGATWDF